MFFFGINFYGVLSRYFNESVKSGVLSDDIFFALSREFISPLLKIKPRVAYVT